MPWSKGLLFYDMAQHFADSVKLASGGRLDIKLFSAGELVGAMESFDAVSKGQAEVGHDWPGYWKGKNENFVSFASVPFGLDTEGYNIWLYERGGLEQMQELYGQYNLFALPGGNGGQEMGLFSNKKATKMADFKGMRVRTPGWYMDIMNSLAPASPRCPVVRSIWLLSVASSTQPNSVPRPSTTRWVLTRSPSMSSSPVSISLPVQCAFFINKDAYNKLPADLKWIVDIAAKETQLWSTAWQENLNIEAIKLFKEKVEFVQMDERHDHRLSPRAPMNILKV